MSVYRERASAVVLNEGKLLTVILQDPTTGNRNFYVPGGAIEPGETPEIAAIRETLEESGYHIRIEPDVFSVCEYPFRWNDKEYQCRTHFFGAWLTSPRQESVSDADYNKGFAWLEMHELEDKLGFHDEIYKAISALTRQMIERKPND